jgi:hypothetical protein
MIRNVYACNTGHGLPVSVVSFAPCVNGEGPLALPLLVPRVGRADDAHDAVPPHDLAVAADFLHRCQYLHLDLAENIDRGSRRATGDTGASDTCYLCPDT